MMQTGLGQGTSPGTRFYTLSDRWIVRRDAQFHSPYSSFGIDCGTKHTIDGFLFVILKLLQDNCLTAQEICSYLQSHGHDVSLGDIAAIINHFGNMNVLVESAYRTEAGRAVEPVEDALHCDVPITSSPYEVEVHLTNGCNLACLHCCYDSGSVRSNELSISAWQDFIDQLEAAEVHRVIVSGGEPLMYCGAPTLLQHLRSKRLRVDVLTNGTLVNQTIADCLGAPNFSTTVSLDGADSEMHELLRGAGSYHAVMAGIDCLQHAGARFHLSSVIHSRNISQMEPLVRFGIQSGAGSVNFVLLDPVGRATEQADLWLKPVDIEVVSDRAKSLAERYRDEISVGYLDPALPDYKDLDTHGTDGRVFCTGGTTRLAVRSDGIVFPCVYAFEAERFSIGSIQLQSLSDIWRAAGWELFRGTVAVDDLTFCRDCELLEACRLKNCRLRAYYSTGDFFGKPTGCYLNAPKRT